MQVLREEARDIISEVLKRQEFAEKEPADVSWLLEILEDILRFLQGILEPLKSVLKSVGKFFDKLVNSLAGIMPDSVDPVAGFNIATIIVYGLVSLVALAIIITVTVLVVRAIRRSQGFSSKGISFEEELVAYSNDADTPYKMARELFEAGDYRGSYRYLFISLLANCSIARLIEVYKSKTNRRYLGEIKRSSQEVHGAAETFFKHFNLYWYGRREVLQSAMELWFSKYDEVKALIEDAKKNKAGGDK